MKLSETVRAMLRGAQERGEPVVMDQRRADEIAAALDAGEEAERARAQAETEHDALRAEVERLRTHYEMLDQQYGSVRQQRDNAMAEVERLKAACLALTDAAVVELEPVRFICPPAFEKAVRLAIAATAKPRPTFEEWHQQNCPFTCDQSRGLCSDGNYRWGRGERGRLPPFAGHTCREVYEQECGASPAGPTKDPECGKIWPENDGKSYICLLRPGHAGKCIGNANQPQPDPVAESLQRARRCIYVSTADIDTQAAILHVVRAVETLAKGK